MTNATHLACKSAIWLSVSALTAGSGAALGSDHFENVFWNTNDSGLFNEASNWDPARVPGDADWAIIAPEFGGSDSDGPFNGTISFNDDAASWQFQVENAGGHLTLDIGAHTYQTLEPSGQTHIGRVTSNNQVSIVSGTFDLGDRLMIGDHDDNVEGGPGGSGNLVEIIGSGTSFEAHREFNIRNDDNTLRIADGASWTTETSGREHWVGHEGDNNELLVEGENSSVSLGGRLRVGVAETASGNVVHVRDGASLSAAEGRIGSTGSGSNNEFRVSGADASLNIDGELRVGDNSGTDNQFVIESGGHATVGDTITLGRSSSVGARIHVDGGTFDAEEVRLNVAGNERSELILENGAEMTATGRVRIGWSDTPDNMLSVTGGSSLNIFPEEDGRLQHHSGLLHIEDGTIHAGHIDATQGGRTNLATTDFASGLLSGDSAEWQNGETLFVGDGGAADATYHMTDPAGTHQFDDGLVLRGNGVLMGEGSIEGDVSVNSSGARLVVGSESQIGLISQTGNLDSTGLTIELAVGDVSTDPLAGENFDHLNITGGLTAGGAVQIDLSDAVLASGDDNWIDLISWDELVGSAEDLDVSFVNGPELDYVVDGTALSLNAIPEPGTAMLLAAGVCTLLARRRTAFQA